MGERNDSDVEDGILVAVEAECREEQERTLTARSRMAVRYLMEG